MEVIFHYGNDLIVTSSQEADGPIGAEHQATWSKTFKDRVEIWFEIVFLPVVPSRLGDQARKLAPDIRESRELADVHIPGLKRLITNGRFGDVIQHVALLRSLFDQVDGCRKLPWEHEQVIGEIELPELSDTLDKFGPGQKQIVRLVLRDVADSD